MPSPTGNRFWHLRSQHGRDKLFATHEALWEAACEYFDWCEDNPIIETTRHGNEQWERIKQRPFTVEGLCIYLGCNMGWLKTFTYRLKKKTDRESREFMDTLKRIRDVIYVQKYTGAATGMFSAHLVVRELDPTFLELEDRRTIEIPYPGN